MGWGELQGAFHNNILKFCIQFSNNAKRKGFGEPQQGQISDIAQGVENFIIVENPVYCLLSRTGSVYTRLKSFLEMNPCSTITELIKSIQRSQ